MNSIDLKINLIEKINEIQDIKFLEAIKTIPENKLGDAYSLSDEQKKSIETSRQQIKDGNFLKNDEVFVELNEWMKKK